jgi:cell division protein ZapE
MDAFKKAYVNLIKQRKLDFDPSQFELAKKLSKFAQIINSWGTLRYKFLRFLKLGKKPKPFCFGMYIWGDVGRGKTMLLNTFYDNLTFNAKKRSYFHEFMINTHKGLNELRKYSDAQDHIKQYASDLARKYKVLILDEVQINNIADAMVVGRLFEALINSEVLVFLSSNRIPIDLFKDGLQRELFMPFIDLIKNRLEVFNLDNSIDYRLQNLRATKTYFHPINTKNKKAVDGIIQSLTGDKPLYEQKIYIDENRRVTALHSYGHMVVFTFAELCEVELSASDYLALCSHFNLIIITNIRKLAPDNHNELLRFITLIDCMYEKGTRLICLSDCEIGNIYKKGKHLFEFQRTISRLNEMLSQGYFQKGSEKQFAEPTQD